MPTGLLQMGYGRRALELLADYYQGNIPSLSEDDGQQYDGLDSVGGASDSDLQHEIIRARKNLPPQLLKLSERRPERLHWLGVSYGMTDELLRFWKKSGYQPVYLRQTQVWMAARCILGAVLLGGICTYAPAHAPLCGR